MICPNCGENLTGDMKFCNKCGHRVKKGKKLLYVIGCVCIIAGLAAGLYVQKNKPIKESEEAFMQACMYEEQSDYLKAFEYYSKVISADKENYAMAQRKIEEINAIFKVNKMAAIGYIVLEQSGNINNLKDLSEIQVNPEKKKFACRIDGIGFVISKTNLDDSDYYSSKKTDIENYYITEYNAVYVDSGFLTSEVNWIRQDTSNTLFMAEALDTSADLININLIMNYISEYQETKILPVI